LLLAVSAVASFILCEVILRVLMNSDAFVEFRKKNYHYFADQWDGSIYRLSLKYTLKGRENDQIFENFDPYLGWNAMPKTKENPVGIRTTEKYTLAELNAIRPVLFFGNSFVEGYKNEDDYKIPQLLDKISNKFKVVNLGVGGYGLDQTFLKFKETIQLINASHVLIGIFYENVDRCVYELMASPKPYFEVTGDSLVLKGIPIPANYGEWLKRYPITIKSYVIAGLKGLLRRARSSQWGVRFFFRFHPSETANNRSQKKTIAKYIIKSIAEECKRKEIPLTFVLFPIRYHLIQEGWYEVFLRDVFNQYEIGYIDTANPLREYLYSNGLSWLQDLYPLDNHPDAKQNEIIAQHIYDSLWGNN